MAKTNKYAAINFNEIYAQRKPSSSQSSHPPSQHTPLSPARPHGRMLVLTRPQLPPPTRPKTPPSDPAPKRFEPDPISLRPLGRADSLASPATATATATAAAAAAAQIKERIETTPRDNKAQGESRPFISTKPEPFVPPHLRPGFTGREERFGAGKDRKEEDGRAKSGGYHKGMTRVGSELDRNRLSSGGNDRPGSGGGSSDSFYKSSPPV